MSEITKAINFTVHLIWQCPDCKQFNSSFFEVSPLVQLSFTGGSDIYYESQCKKCKQYHNVGSKISGS